MRVVHRQKYKGQFSMDYSDRGSHALGVYSTQYNSRMGTARVKQKEETDTRVIARTLEERNVGIKGKIPR